MAGADDSTSLWAVSPRPPLRPRVAVLVGSGQGVPRLVALRKAELVIGRGEEADIRLEARGVSRAHTKLVLAGVDSVTVVDLQSKNGTFINGRAVDAAALEEGDELGIGPVAVFRFTVRDEDEIPATKTAATLPALQTLTTREREVAELVAQGLSNPAIAERLSIKPRTVTSHLEHVFAKLGVRSRTELTRIMVTVESSSP
jgi:DNA-binding CsgD family transcriptional regulator